MLGRHTPVRRRLGYVSVRLAVLVALAGCGSGSTPPAPAGLGYSTVSASEVQRQPDPGSCHARGGGLYVLPDARCTPGSLNPAVTQATIDATICHHGWTARVRPPESVTEPEKIASMAAYGHRERLSRYEYDHEVALELGGAVNDPRNLWPEPNYTVISGEFRNPKDRLAQTLNHLVCGRRMQLSQAQRLIAHDWVTALRRYG